jgi:catechol 2,3-dioxygenase-like lactoylglutathione lyase family enzyme
MTIHGVTPLLQVFNMPRSVAFYRDVLGFAVIHTSEPGEQFDWAMLKRGDAVLMLNTAYESHERPSAPDPERVAAHADTILFFGCESVDEVAAHLKAKGWRADEPVTTHYAMRQLYTKDPDGYELCFQHPVNKS